MTDCGTCTHYSKHLRFCRREKRGDRCEWEKKPRWVMTGHKQMTDEERRKAATVLLGYDPGPQYEEDKEATA